MTTAMSGLRRDNPYNRDLQRSPFVGREAELTTLADDLLRGRSALAAVMAGRGMGKTSFALDLERRLTRSGGDVRVLRWARTPTERAEFLDRLGRDLEYEFKGRLLDDEIAEAINRQGSSRTILMLDEVDALISSPETRTLLELLRIAWQELGGRLGIVILGGSSLYELLETQVSPFLRNAEFIPLRGLARAETRALICEPLGLAIPEGLSEWIWEETAGHPALITEIMRAAVDRGEPIADQIPRVIDDRLLQGLESRYFHLWWRNLGEPGQELYRALITRGIPLPERDLPQLARPPASRYLQVLETTGLARLEAGEILPRGQLFLNWARHEHFAARPSPPSRAPGATFVERLQWVLSRWRADCREFAGRSLKSGSSGKPILRGNERLMPEAHFQLGLVLALKQHEGWQVEAEPYSSSGRADIKVTWGDERCCIELKIWGRNDYQAVTEQGLGYALSSDPLAVVVMIDRQQDSLLDRYRDLLATKGYDPIDGPASGPDFITTHCRIDVPAIAVHHYLLHLPADRVNP